MESRFLSWALANTLATMHACTKRERIHSLSSLMRLQNSLSLPRRISTSFSSQHFEKGYCKIVFSLFVSFCFLLASLTARKACTLHERKAFSQDECMFHLGELLKSLCFIKKEQIKLSLFQEKQYLRR